MNSVFLDTVGLIAVWDKADQWHDDAETVFLKLVTSGKPILTTTLVLYECGNAAARRPYRTSVDDLRSWLAEKGWLIDPTVSDLDAAWAEYREGIVRCRGDRRSRFLRRHASARHHRSLHQ